MKKVVVIAVHPDDETLAVGGTILKHKKAGNEIHWVIVTNAKGLPGYTEERLRSRQAEITKVSALYNFDSVTQLGFTATRLGAHNFADLMNSLSQTINSIKPDTVYIPWGGDAHTDHKMVFDAFRPVLKSFRYPFIKTVLAMETLSETHEAVMLDQHHFIANWWTDITPFIDKKVEIVKEYAGESAPPPFPRNSEMIKNLASLRGSQSGTLAAEAFNCLIHRN